jgi:phosphoesterase RecJ-like protein
MLEFKNIIDHANTIVVIQADNPDGDSLSSALALEEILADRGKEVVLYCGVETPTYLRYMKGWDRIVHELPRSFDVSVIVDTAALTLLETLENSGELAWVKAKPCVVIDHHVSESTIDFANIILQERAVSTGEIIYSIAQSNQWTINKQAAEFLAISIFSDSLGLISESTTPNSIRVVADLVESGVNLSKLEEARRALNKKSPELLNYKAKLIERIKYTEDLQTAYVHIPWEEIEKYSHQYNPSVLVLDEMRMVEGVKLAIAFKSYPDGRITAKIRANSEGMVADKLAESFGGGGHPYAAGFKINDGRKIEEIITQTITKVQKLLDNTQQRDTK